MSSSRPFLSTSVLRSKSIEAELYSPRMNVLLQVEQISRRIYTPSSAYVNIPNDISSSYYGIKEGIGSARSIPDEEETKNDWYLCRERLPRYLILTSDDRPRRHVLLQLNRESASDGLHDTRGPALLAQFRVPVVVMRVPHVLRGNFIFEKGSFGHEHSGRLYAADELVPGENNRVFVHGRLTDAGQMWVHVDLHVRGCKI